MRVEPLLTMLSAALALVASAAAQTVGPNQALRAPLPIAEPRLAFEREVFAYPGGTRRDPFKPLERNDASGPLYEDLVLRGIVWSSVPSQSVVLLHDGMRKIYKLRVGEKVGNARVIAIEKDHVRFAVTNFGMTRPEIMNKARPSTIAELKAQETELAQPQETELGRLLQQQLLRALRQRDSTSINPPVRRDTTTRPPRGDQKK
jgi:hypothetical protein